MYCRDRAILLRMNGFEQALVIILSVFLAIFLILGIVVFSLLIKIMQTVQRITTKAEYLADRASDLTDRAAAVGQFFEHAAGPVALARIFAGVAERFMGKSKNNKRKQKFEE